MSSLISPPSLPQLSAFSGRDASTYNAFSAEALLQGTLIWQIATCLDPTTMPNPTTDPVNYQLAQNAIMAISDRIYLEQPYDEINAKPFVAEGIGGYHYSRSSFGSKLLVGIQSGQPTGVFWFDSAVSRLGVCKTRVKGGGGGIAINFNSSEVRFRNCQTGDFSTETRVIGPAERNRIDFPDYGSNYASFGDFPFGNVPEWWFPGWWEFDQ